MVSLDKCSRSYNKPDNLFDRLYNLNETDDINVRTFNDKKE